jgi:hypothetical protein
MTATFAQIEFIKKLLADRLVPNCFEIDLDNLTRYEASRAIEILKQRPKIHVDLISEKQLAYLTSIINRRPDADFHRERIVNKYQINDLQGLNRDQAKNEIDLMLRLPLPLPDIAVGAYELDGTVYSVRKGNYSGKIHAVVYDPDQKKWVDDLTKSIYKLKDEHRLTLSRATQLSVAVGSCVHCGRTLTLQKSVVAGMGRVCASKYH